jgi:hypothetical protein
MQRSKAAGSLSNVDNNLIYCIKINAMEDNRMKTHVTVVAVLMIVLGILGVFVVSAVGFFYNYLKDFIPLQDIPDFAVPLIEIAIVFFLVVAGSLAILELAAGIGLLACKNWARIVGIVVAGFNCLSVPIGTLFGVYSIWVLVQDDTVKMCGRQA